MNAAVVAGLPWIQALGWTLLHFLWQGAVVGGVFALLRASIPKHHCNARYVNGLVALVALAVLPLATLLSLHAQQVAQIQVMPPTAALLAATAVQAGEGVAESIAMAPVEGLLVWIVALWLAGVCVSGLRSWSQWRALLRVARQWAVPDAGLQQITATLAIRFEFARRIRVLVSDRIDTPTLIGWIKPVILLPTAVALGFPRQQIELILAHELGHLRRCDHLVNLAQAVVETLLFYHPVVHWVAREVRNERELCCDALVLRVTRGEPREYASALAALEELRQPLPQLALAASGGVLLERVRRILFAQQPAATRAGLRLWLPAVAVVVVALTAALRIERSEIRYVDGPLLWSVNMSPTATPSLAAPDLQPMERIARPHFAQVELPQGMAPPVPSPAPVAAPLPSGSAAAPGPTAPVSSLAATATLPVDPAVPLSIAGIPVAKPIAQVAPAIAAPPRRAPVATRTVAPEFPQSVRQDRGVRVELNFAIAADGRVRDISLLSSSVTNKVFARAAERALSQWRFDPATVPGGDAAHYRQAFVFSPQGAVGDNVDGCVRRTGSLLCQRLDNAAGDGGTVAEGKSLLAATPQ